MIDFLNKKFPAPYPSRKSMWISIGFGLFVGFFLLYFQPFGISRSTYEHKTLIIGGYGVISFLVTFIVLYIVPMLMPRVFHDERWTLGHQLLLYFVLIFLIATANGIYANIVNDAPFSWYQYGIMISWTYALGSISITFILLVEHYLLTLSHLRDARSIVTSSDTAVSNTQSTEQSLSINLANDELITIPLNGLTHISADGNYVRIQHIDQPSQIYRLSLSRMEEQIQSSQLLRCHRSYIVNMDMVSDGSGNAQGLRLSINGMHDTIPVSRKYIPTIKSYFAKSAKS